MPPRAVAALPPSGPHLALAAWINAATDTATVLEVPPDVRADLIRDGVAPQRLGPGGTLVVTRGAPGPGRPVARFGDGPDALAVSRTDASGGAGRRQLLATRPSRRGPGARRAAGGQADPRALLVLAVLAARTARCTCSTCRVSARTRAAPPPGRPSAAGLADHAARGPFVPLPTVGDTTTLAWPVCPSGLLGRERAPTGATGTYCGWRTVAGHPERRRYDTAFDGRVYTEGGRHGPSDHQTVDPGTSPCNAALVRPVRAADPDRHRAPSRAGLRPPPSSADPAASRCSPMTDPPAAPGARSRAPDGRARHRTGTATDDRPSLAPDCGPAPGPSCAPARRHCRWRQP